jgi:DNA-binding transcriptional ArsR family regulator
MPASPIDAIVSDIAAAIGEPARARMLFCLMDGRARTSTELSVVAEVSPSTASVHLARLAARHLVTVVAQGKHRYYRLEGPAVGRALEALSVVAGASRHAFVPTAPNRLRTARTCYDHMAGTVAVMLHDRFKTLGWIRASSSGGPASNDGYELTTAGAASLEKLGVAVSAAQTQRRRFAYACLDWSERTPHVGGALGAAVLTWALRRRWLAQDLDSRALSVTAAGRRHLNARLGLRL